MLTVFVFGLFILNLSNLTFSLIALLTILWSLPLFTCCIISTMSRSAFITCSQGRSLRGVCTPPTCNKIIYVIYVTKFKFKVMTPNSRHQIQIANTVGIIWFYISYTTPPPPNENGFATLLLVPKQNCLTLIPPFYRCLPAFVLKSAIKI